MKRDGVDAHYAFHEGQAYLRQSTNSMNSKLIEDFHSYMKGNATSERHQNNNLKAVIAFAEFIGYETTFYQISTKEQVTILGTSTSSTRRPVVLPLPSPINSPSAITN
jgi:hypothetical protein